MDLIVFATGYNYDFPYLPNNVMYKSGHRLGLYKLVLPPNMEHPTLAIVGFIHSDGAIMPQAEMQARWVTRVFKGEKGQVGGCRKRPAIISHLLSLALQDIKSCLQTRL